ncbi:50S ribosomal protein L29 [Patescibacteria group bacterium]|nr:50S ribosomal protein L29 [Patescibacteria group bacterium]
MANKAHDLRNLSQGQLTGRLTSMRAELVEHRENVRLGKEKNHRQLRYLRRDIARAETVLQELQSR